MASLPTFEKKLWAFVPKFRNMWPKKVGKMAKSEIKSGQRFGAKTPQNGQKQAFLGCFRAHKYRLVTKLAKNPLFLL
jgi:hypothetical protein